MAFGLILAALVAGAVPAHGKGVLCLTFDDTHYDNWVAALPIFERYGAHAAFFPCGRLTTNEMAKIRRLCAAGHAVGYHSLTHRDVPARLKAVGSTMYIRDEIDPAREKFREAGLPLRHFAYPNNRHDERSDCELSRRFTRFRAGAGTFRYNTNGTSIVSLDKAFFPVADLPKRRVLGGTGVGPHYRTDVDDLCRGIRRAAERDEVLVLYSHDIGAEPKGVGLSREWLERLLRTAAENGVAVRSFDELGPLEPQTPAEPLKVALDFDDGVKDHLLVAAPELEKRGWRAQFSIVTDWVGTNEFKLTWDDIRELRRRGHLIVNHSKSHDLRRGGLGGMARMGRLDEVRRDLRESQAVFKRELGEAPCYLSLPGSAYVEEVGVAAAEAGLRPVLVFGDCFGGESTDVTGTIRFLRDRGIRQARFIVHGIRPEGKGWIPFASREAFVRYLDDLKAAEESGLISVVGYEALETP